MALAFIGPGASHFLDSAKQRNYTAAAIGAVEVAAGLALAFGWQVRWLALAAAAFLLVDAFSPTASGPPRRRSCATRCCIFSRTSRWPVALCYWLHRLPPDRPVSGRHGRRAGHRSRLSLYAHQKSMKIQINNRNKSVI
jgi:hypothetical protein